VVGGSGQSAFVNRNRKVQSFQESNSAEVGGFPAAVVQVVGRRPAGWISAAGAAAVPLSRRR
jgi:hypothetical protein